MNARNLVLEFKDTDSAAEIQDRLDRAADDGFFLVNVVGRLAFLRTSIALPKTAEVLPPPVEIPVNQEAVAAIRGAMRRCKLPVLTLQDLRVRGGFNDFPEKEWYAALKTLENDGEFEMRKTVTPRGKTRMIVMANHG